MAFLASVKVIADGGRLEAFPERISAERANAVTIVVAAATNFRGRDHRAAVEQALTAAAATPYQKLKGDHIADHQQLFRRAGLSLGAARPDFLAGLPTDERLEKVKTGAVDLGLEALYFQFGRYLLIASSRPGGLPANLQGLWNDSMFPPWDSDYHLNINLQMNYWPAEVTNLAELHQPLFDYLESLREPGRKTARVHYGAKGFVAHHISDVWGFTTPGDRPRSGLWPMGAAWLTLHLWEHYLFNPDREFLEKAYPVMKESAEFFLDYLVDGCRRDGSSADRLCHPRTGTGFRTARSASSRWGRRWITRSLRDCSRRSSGRARSWASTPISGTRSRRPRREFRRRRLASTARFRSGPTTTTSPIRVTGISLNCSRCIPAIR